MVELESERAVPRTMAEKILSRAAGTPTRACDLVVVDVAMVMSHDSIVQSVNRAMQRAREMGMLTIGFSGRDGGRLSSLCDYCFTVPSFSIHRIQEVHTTLLHVMWDMVHVMLGEEDVI